MCTGGAEFVCRTKQLLIKNGPKALDFVEKSIMKTSELYLLAYNALQFLGWSYIFFVTLTGVSHSLSNAELYTSVEPLVKLFQTAMILEVVHCAVGLVRSPVATTAMQIASRVTVVWPVLHCVPSARDSIGVPMLLLAWSVTEMIRYSFYASSLLRSTPSLLVFLRYTLFIVLYPLGASGELFTVVRAMPEVGAKGILSLALPNASNMSFSFWWALAAMCVVYIPGFPQMYFYMFAQRKKVLGGGVKKEQ